MEPSAALFLTALALTVASPDQSADKAIRNAYLKKSGIERNIKRTTKDFEREYLTEEARKVLGNTYLVSKIIIDKKVTFTWTFK